VNIAAEWQHRAVRAERRNRLLIASGHYGMAFVGAATVLGLAVLVVRELTR
jgi:hypothetical protein